MGRMDSQMSLHFDDSTSFPHRKPIQGTRQRVHVFIPNVLDNHISMQLQWNAFLQEPQTRNSMSSSEDMSWKQIGQSPIARGSTSTFDVINRPPW
jgi:hypothetical protein